MTTRGFSFSQPRRRRHGENVVPMINVVFLLLIFFLLSAQITPPGPFEIAPANATDAARAEAEQNMLWIDAEGQLAFGMARDEDVWAALPRDLPKLHIRADAQTPAATVAQVLTRLTQLGIAEVTLLTSPGAAR